MIWAEAELLIGSSSQFAFDRLSNRVYHNTLCVIVGYESSGFSQAPVQKV